MNIPYIMKKCTICGEWLVASTVNFCRAKRGRYGLNSKCRECERKRHKQYYQSNRDKLLEQNKQYYETNKEKRADYRKQWYQANPEYNKQYREANKEKIAKQKKQYYEANRDKIADYYKQYRKDNKGKIAERNKQYREENKEKMTKYNKQYYEDNKEKILEQQKQYSQTPQGKVVAFNHHQRRRIKEEQQGSGITKDQWLELMSFFDFRCAYSGEYIGGDSFNRTIDHIVPIDGGGDNMVWNMVPMTRSLNSSKSTKDMEKWYREQSFYSEARLEKIYKWQEYAYNKYGKDTQYFNSSNIQIKLI